MTRAGEKLEVNQIGLYIKVVLDVRKVGKPESNQNRILSSKSGCG